MLKDTASRRLASTSHEEFLLSCVLSDYRALGDLDIAEQSDSLFQVALSLSPTALELMKCPSAEQILESVQKYGSSIRYIKPNDQTESLCFAAVTQNPHAIAHCAIRTDNVCLAAIKQKFAVLFYIEDQTEEMCLEALKQSPTAACYFNDTFEPDFYLKCIDIQPEAIQHFPKRALTKEVCLAASQKDWKLMQYAPTSILDEDICIAAYEQDVRALRFMWPELGFEKFYVTYQAAKGATYSYVDMSTNSQELTILKVFQNERDHEIKAYAQNLNTQKLSM